jgi:4-hydroxybenzoate polyprenyltransferase
MMQGNAQALERVSAGISAVRLLATSVRPREWIKNGFLFAALIFSENLFNLELFSQTLIAFAIFCFAAGGVYLINDILDRHQDEIHPRKSMRPIASGALPVALAAPAAVLLFVTALTGAFLLKVPFGLVVAAYVLLSVAYSKWLKHTVILDVFAIALGFVLRVVAGAVVIDVMMSHWLIICTLLLALFLGFSKRREELVALADDASLHRRVLTEYSPLFLDMMIGIVTSATVVAYTLYTVSNETIERFGTDRLLFTVPFVLYGIFRYLYLVYHKNNGGAPAQTLITDKPLLFNVVLWAVVCGLIIYTAKL